MNIKVRIEVGEQAVVLAVRPEDLRAASPEQFLLNYVLAAFSVMREMELKNYSE